MNDLIKISNSNIGSENVNSVNARDIHTYLGVKTPFSMWIDRAIKRYWFQKDEDFTTHSFVNGKATQIDFIVTIDMAKELCMLENNEKGRETRKYFIRAEKKSNRVLTPQEQIALLAQGSVEQEKRLCAVEQKIDNEILLTSAQKHHLKNLVSKKVFDLKETHNFDDGFIRTGYQRVWKILKKHFIVSSYMEIPKVKFEEAVKIVNNVCMGDLM